MEFLDEREALEALRELFATASEARLAVAFWGAGARERLGLDRPGLDLRIVCNLDSGACNPAEIGKFRTPFKAAVRSDPRLHGKVYWTPTAVLIGSSNASANGLAVEGAALAGWAEANVMIQDPALIARSRAWFDERWAASYEISDLDLKKALKLWRQRSRSANLGARLSSSLVEAFRSSPDHPAWRSVKVALWSEDLSPAARRRIAADKSANPILEGYGSYEGWQEEIAAGDWIVDFQLSETSAALTGYWSSPERKLENDLVTYVREETAVRLPGFPSLALSAADRRRFERSAWQLVRGEGGPRARNAILSLERALQRLDEMS